MYILRDILGVVLTAGVAGLILFLYLIARFYEQKSQCNKFSYWFILPFGMLVLGISFFSFVKLEEIAYLFLSIGGGLLIIISKYLYDIMTKTD